MKIMNNTDPLNTFKNRLRKLWKFLDLEAFVWLAGLMFLIFFHSPGESHFTICPLANLGLDFCPGCGLGNSISYLIKGEFISSFHSHPLGIFALIIIISRIISIINNRRRYA